MNELFLNRMKNYLSIDDYNKLIDAYKMNPARSIRLNNIDYDKFVNVTNMPLKKINYDQDGYYLLNEEKYGNHPYHHLGAFYFQEPSAMAPVNMYEFKGDEIVLDLCAAPGGKSSQILKRIPNGVLFTNDPSKKRSQILFGNLERLGFSNAVILNETPNRIASKLKGFFDVILVDAPCSGEGMIRKDEDARNLWSESLVKECEARDYEILASANEMLKPNGVLIYSTCTFSKEEDENIVNHMVEKYNYKVLDAPLKLKNVTKEGFIKETLRFYPFTGDGEGQYMALLQKDNTGETYYKKDKGNKKPDAEMKIVNDFIKENLNDVYLNIRKEGNRYYHSVTDADLSGLSVLNFGVELGEVLNKRFVPYHHMFKALGKYFKNKLVLDVEDSRVLHYMRGEEIDADVPNGYGVIEIDGLYLGGFKASNGKLKNHYPKGLRNMNLIEE